MPRASPTNSSLLHRSSRTDAASASRTANSIIFFNFRPDRARQLSHALVDRTFDGFARSRVLDDVELVTFTEYERDLDAQVAFPRDDVAHTLAEEVSAAGSASSFMSRRPRSTRMSPTSSTAAAKTPFDGEERLLIPSPRVATYDLAPEMSAARRRRCCHCARREGRRTRSSSPTSPTPTWSATPATSTPRCAPSHASTRASGASRTRSRWRMADCSSRPTTATPSTRSIVATDQSSPRTRRAQSLCSLQEPATDPCVTAAGSATSRRPCSTRWDCPSLVR